MPFESFNDRYSRYVRNASASWYMGTVVAFGLISCFCFVLFVLTLTASEAKDTTLFDEDIDVRGGSEDYDPRTTTEQLRQRVTRKIPTRKESATTRNTRYSSPAIAPRPTMKKATAPTTTATRARKAEEAPPGTLVCTVSNLMPPKVSALPPDGVCDLLFFESFYKGDKNIVADGYGALEQNALFFVNQAPSGKRTEYGASFMFTNTISTADFMSAKFYSGVNDLSSRNIYHFGFLNLYREYSTPRAVTDALLVLKELYFHAQQNGFQQPCFMVLGVSIDFAANHTTVDLMGGRYYAPKLELEDTPDRYKPYEDCKDFSGPYYDDPANVCPTVAGADWVLEESMFYQYKALVNQKLKRTFTYDTVDTIKTKVCDAKRSLLNVSYGVAAYDVDFDSSPQGCGEMGIEPGAFNRLSIIRPLSNFLVRNFTGYTECLELNSTSSLPA
ncbi:hypothetical protein HPB50_007498 [Hyalomma asiaticum]|uniref:Uncharacterized protein n=1 Tax=Hyalomma asiaticum TaxID=266040 RepID=A0ACB7RMX6_HYAAI|nr:hypothetical protein HPB50_007498 [Hyalomma asiaticum]